MAHIVNAESVSIVINGLEIPRADLRFPEEPPRSFSVTVEVTSAVIRGRGGLAILDDDAGFGHPERHHHYEPWPHYHEAIADGRFGPAIRVCEVNCGP